MTSVKMKRFIILICIVFTTACGGVKLIDISKTSSTLNLSSEQLKAITPRISLIRDIVEDYKFEKDVLESHYHGYRSEARMDRLSPYEGDRRMYRQSVRARHSLRAKFREFIIQRNAYLKEIAGLTDEIKSALTPEQQIRFAEIKIPDLKLPSMIRRSHFRDLEMIPGTRPFGRF